MATETQQVLSSSGAGLENALRILHEGITALIDQCEASGQQPSLFEELKKSNHFVNRLKEWGLKIPESRLKDSILCFLKHIVPLIQKMTAEGMTIPDQTALREGESVPDFLLQAAMDVGIDLNVTNENMAAVIRIPQQVFNLWNVDRVKESLRRQGITKGILESNLRRIFEEKLHGHTILAAKGKDPVVGRNGRIEDSLKLFTRSKSNKSNSARHCDLIDLNFFECVKKGQVILRKHPPDEGENGWDVYGKEIPSIAGLNTELPSIENCAPREDGSELLSEVDGCAYVEDNRIVITPALTINGNVDHSTGNIDTHLSVIVTGDVISGFEVDSEMDIAVCGGIEAAKVKAGGTLFCQGGIDGKEEAQVTAGKNVESQYINLANVTAGHSIVSQNGIVQSNLEARRVLCEGSKGQIMGGKVSAWYDVYARTIGSEMGVETEIVLGEELPSLREKIRFLASDLDGKLKQKGKLKKAQKALFAQKTKLGTLPPPLQEKLKQVMDALRKLERPLKKLKEQYNQIEKDIEQSETSIRKVCAEETIYPGSIIRIAGKTLTVKKILGPTIVYLKGGELVTAPIEENSDNE